MGQGWWEVGDFGRYGVLSLAEGTDCCIHYIDYASTKEDMTEASLALGIVCMLMFCAGTQMCGGHCVCVHVHRSTDVWWSLCVDVLCRNADVWCHCLCFVQEHKCVVVTVCWCFVHSVCWCFVQEHRYAVVTLCVDVLCRSTAVQWSLCVLLFCAGTQLCGGHCVAVLCRNTNVQWSLCLLMFCAGTQMCGVTVCVLCRNTNVWWSLCVDVLCTVCVDVLCRNTDMRWSLCVLMFCAGAQLCSGHCVCCCFVQEHSCVVVTVLLFCAGTQMCSGHCVCWCFVQEHRCVVVTVCVNVLCTVCVDVLCRSTAVLWSQRVTWSRHAVSSQLSPAATSSAFSEQISRSEFTETLGQRFIGYRVRPKVAG